MQEVPSHKAPLWNGAARGHDKLRIAYLSGDFREHVVSSQTAELFELHDRTLHEIYGISFGIDDRSEIRTRLTQVFDQFHDVRSRSDHDVARLVSDLQIDIAIDLTGLTQGCRPGIFAYRPAPVQVNYLGYPGTLGADFIDYIIGDRFVLPFDQQPHFSERIVHLPGSFLATDSRKSIAADVPSRQECGLPETGFVYCCFNSNYKITQQVFEVWMRLVSSNPGSVIWLGRDNGDTEHNLRREAEMRGVAATRLVFAARLPAPQHLARHRLADLFLDTLPYNAHSTACDALWAGLPVLTCVGRTFASRVAASLLHAVGLPELVTHDLSDYETLATRLATDPALLRGCKLRLEENRLTHPLFATKQFTRHMEAAYATMWKIHQSGEGPRSFRVEPI
jgi:protein O-GlcNAc transferase